jgi:hypothetical protein
MTTQERRDTAAACFALAVLILGLPLLVALAQAFE